LFTATDVMRFTVRNAEIHVDDPVISLIDGQKVLFEKVGFLVPGDGLIPEVEGIHMEALAFKKCDSIDLRTGDRRSAKVNGVAAGRVQSCPSDHEGGNAHDEVPQ
jgi:hypothetical protein